jgi:tRNA-(ms[2]io[6]A)-hydroxylase
MARSHITRTHCMPLSNPDQSPAEPATDHLAADQADAVESPAARGFDTTLQVATDPRWAGLVLQDFDRFLLDHASCEKKASSLAMTLISHYPDRVELVRAMTDLAVEELNHFREVVRHILARNLTLGRDEKDPYVTALFQHMRKGSDLYFMDRLILASIVEARGHERFGLVAEALPPGPLKQFYRAITASEGRHLDLFMDLALRYFPAAAVQERCAQLLQTEADIVHSLPLRAALH